MSEHRLTSGQPALLLALATAGILLRFAFVGRSYWFDELATLVAVDQPNWLKVLDVTSRDNQPPLYNSLAFVWTRAFGFNEWPVRGLSILLGLLALATPWLARQSLSRDQKWLCFALLCLMPLPIRYAQEARNYSLLFLLSASCLFCCYEWLTVRSRRAVALLYILLAPLAFSHLFGLLLAVSFLATLFWLQRSLITRLLLMLYALALSALVIVPLLHGGSGGRAGGNFWIKFTAASLAEQLLVVFSPVGLLLLLYALMRWRRRQPPVPLDRALLWAVAPFVLTFLGALLISLNTPILTDRNLIELIPAYALLSVWLLQSRSSPAPSGATLALLGLLLLQTAVWAFSPYLFIQQDFRTIARQSIDSNSRVCFVAPTGTKLPHHLFAFYVVRIFNRPDLQPEDMVLADVPQDLAAHDCHLWAVGSLARRGESLLRTLPQFARCRAVPLGKPGVRMASELLDCPH